MGSARGVGLSEPDESGMEANGLGKGELVSAPLNGTSAKRGAERGGLGDSSCGKCTEKPNTSRWYSAQKGGGVGGEGSRRSCPLAEIGKGSIS